MADVRYSSVSDRGVLGLFATNMSFPFPLVTANFNRRFVSVTNVTMWGECSVRF
jgi:hypothetical protein